MKKFGPDAHALIAAGRKRVQPTAADRDRVGEKLAARLPAFGALASVTHVANVAAQAAAPSIAAASGAAGGIAGKLVALGAIAAATAVTTTTILLVGRGDRPVAPRPPAAIAVAAPVNPAAPVRAATIEPAPVTAPAIAVRPVPAASSRVAKVALDPRPAPALAPGATEPARVVNALQAAEPMRRVHVERERRRDPPPSAVPEPPVRAATAAPPAPPAVAAPAAAPGETMASALRAIEQATAVASDARPLANPDMLEAPPAAPSAQSAADALAPELSLLDAARSALRASDPARALQLTDRLGALFPQSELMPERLALRALSLCALRRGDASRRAIAELEQQAPGSPLAAGVRKACAVESAR